MGRQQDRGRGPRPATHLAAGLGAGRVDRHGRLHRRQRGVSLPGAACPDRVGRTAFAALAGDALFGRTGEVIFAAVVVISVAGSLAAVLMASPRVYYAMARDGLFFPSFAAVDPRRGTPARATAIQADARRGTGADRHLRPDPLLLHGPDPGLSGARRWSRSSCSTAARPAAAPLATPGYPVSPLLFLVPVLIVIVLRILRDPAASSIGLFVVVLGIPVSGWVLSDAGPPASARPDSSPRLR